MGYSRWTRRELLGRAAGGLLGTALAGPAGRLARAQSHGQAKPSDRFVLGMIGLGGMGTAHLHALRAEPDVQIVALCDVDRQHLEAAANLLGGGVATYAQYQELLARDDLDGVVIATPDHWHGLIAMAACAAGKDVYCEKPLSLTVAEARRMVSAARRHATVFQVGSQQRSAPEFRRACEYVLSGRIGKLQRIHARIGGAPMNDWEPAQDPPATLDWNTWLGPAPWTPYVPCRSHYTFRWFYEYSGGKVTDWGAHHVDIAQWAHGSSLTGPTRIEPISARFPVRGLFNTATQFEAKVAYADGVELMVSSDKNDVELHGSDGWIVVNRGKLEASVPDILNEPLGRSDVHLPISPGHYRNWLNAIRTRERPICDVEIGARSVSICHLVNIALRTGQSITWDPEHETITNDAELNRWLDRPYRAPWRT